MKLKSVSVKVEHKQTGEIVQVHDCGTNEEKADQIESELSARSDLDDYHVYISYEMQSNAKALQSD